MHMHMFVFCLYPSASAGLGWPGLCLCTAYLELGNCFSEQRQLLKWKLMCNILNVFISCLFDIECKSSANV